MSGLEHSQSLVGLFSKERQSIGSLHQSEQIVIRMGLGAGWVGSVLDLGCAYGGLFEALTAENITPTEYRGVDLSKELISAAKLKYRGADDVTFECSDFNSILKEDLSKYDLVCALNSFDFNESCFDLIMRVGESLCPDGLFLLSIRTSMRLGDETQLIGRQKIEYKGESDCEVPYLVISYQEFIRKIEALQLTIRFSVTYERTPSKSATIAIPKIGFSTFLLSKLK